MLRVYDTMEALLERLPKAKFLRVNRSVIINVFYVKKYDHTYLELIDEDVPITIGSTYRKNVYQVLTDYFWRK